MNRWSIFFFSLFGIGVFWAAGHFWVLLNSGEEIVSKEIFRIEDSRIHNREANSKLRHNTSSYQSLSADLFPEMNPIGVFFDCKMLKSSLSRSTFTVELEASSGEIAQTLPIKFRVDNSGASGTGSNSGTTRSLRHVGSLDVATPDEYRVRVIPGDKQGVPITQLSIRLRRNVMIPPLASLFGAVLTGILGMSCGILSVLVGRSSKLAGNNRRVASGCESDSQSSATQLKNGSEEEHDASD